MNPNSMQLKQIVRIQRAFRIYLNVKQYRNMQRKARYRYYIIKEIIDSEQIYVNDMQSLVDKIMIPIQAQKILRTKQIKQIFSNIKSILNVNIQMLNQLQQHFLNYHPYQQTIKGILKYISYFKLYFDYCNGFAVATQVLEECISTNLQFKVFIQQNIHQLKTHDLMSVIVKPVQRLPKYILLFRDLLKHTSASHPDYQNILQCLESFKQINDGNNQTMDKQLGAYKIFELSRQFSNQLDLIQSQRNFKFEDSCSILQNNKLIDVTIYCLSDLILIVVRTDVSND